MNIQYEVIRSARKTMSLQIKDAKVIVRAPKWVARNRIDQFVLEHRTWIEKQLAVMQQRKKTEAGIQKLTFEDINALADQALIRIPERVRYYAQIIGVTYGNITIRNQKSRWGSCSAKGNLNFNCLLMLAPPEVLDSIVVHELCHRKEMNHSTRFYEEVLKAFPNYWECNQWIKEHGRELMARML